MTLNSRPTLSLTPAPIPNVLLALLLVAGLVACQSSGDESAPESAPPAVEVTMMDDAFQAPNPIRSGRTAFRTGTSAPVSSAAPLAQDIDWHELILLRFDTAETRRARALTEHCLHRAASSPSPPALRVIELPGGPWDLMVIYSLRGAASETPALEKKWKTPADLGPLREACRKAGDDRGDGVWAEYKGLLESSTSFVGFSGRIGRGLARP